MVEDSIDVVAPKFKVEATGEMVQLRNEILLNLSDVRYAEIRKQEDRENVDVFVIFTSEGQKIFRQITGENIGKRLGVLIDDELIMVPVIMVQINFGKALVYYNIPEEDAKLKVELINQLLKQ
jgi:preprotein translocase subunit SecD